MSSERPSFLLRHKWLISVLIFVVLFVPVDWLVGYVVFHRGDYRQHEDTGGNWAAGGAGIRVSSAHYHHGLAALGTATDQWGPEAYTLMTNSLGFKDGDTREVPLKAEGKRVVFLGDSFTEAVGIAHEDTWVGIVQDGLEGEGIEVLNAGVVSYSPKLYFYKTLYLVDVVGLRFDELVVFIDVSDVPDELLYSEFIPEHVLEDDPWAGRFEKGPRPLGLLDYSLMGRTLRKNLGYDPWKSTRFTDRETGEGFDFTNLRDSWAHRPDLQRRWGQVGLDSCIYYMEQLASLCEEHGIRLTLGIYPWPRELETGQMDNLHSATWRSFAREHDLELIDLYPVFAPEDGEARKALRERAFIPGDVHYNEFGQRLWGEAVLDFWHKSRE